MQTKKRNNALMYAFTEGEHRAVLGKHTSNVQAAKEYNYILASARAHWHGSSRNPVTRQNVKYWRKIYLGSMYGGRSIGTAQGAGDPHLDSAWQFVDSIRNMVAQAVPASLPVTVCMHIPVPLSTQARQSVLEFMGACTDAGDTLVLKFKDREKV